MNKCLVPHNNSFVSRFFNDPYDLLFRDFFETDSFFDSMFEKRLSYPVDIKENTNGIEFDIAVVGLDKKNIKIEINDNTLSVSYTKEEETNDSEKNKSNFLYKGITNKSFSMAWRISNKFDLSKLTANLDKGLLKILIPLSPVNKPKEIEII